MDLKFPPIPRHHQEVRFAYEDLETKKRIYLADTYHSAVAFIGFTGSWGTIKPHNGGSEWRIEL